MTPASIIIDGPFCANQGTPSQKCFRNFGGSAGAGPQTMRWGLEQSRNLMTVRAANQIGMDKVTRMARQMGVGDYRQLSRHLARRRRHHRAQDDQRLRDLRQSGPGADPDPDRLCPGPARPGDLARRHEALRGLQRARLGRPADAAPAACAPARWSIR